MIKVLKAGFYSSIQDKGREGFGSVGVPVSGVMDVYSSNIANSILDNSLSDAVLEITFGGTQLQFISETFICLSGGDFSPKINGKLINMNSRIRVNKNDVFAAQLFGKFTLFGEAPFNQLALLGGENLMRGYYLGRYRDDNLLAAQVEYRMLPFSFSKRWGASFFLASGQVFSDENKLALNRFLPTAGTGLRFLLFPEKDIYTRLDFAFTQEGPGFYFFIGEAF